MHPLIAFAGITCFALSAGNAGAAALSSNCSQVGARSTEALVCSDADLRALDVRLAKTYSAALHKTGGDADALKAAQQAWVESQHDCAKAEDEKACLKLGYERRIAELQARYRLVKATGTATYICDGSEEPIHARYYPTVPPSAIVTRGNETIFMTVQPAASGARYVGGNASVWEHHGEALIRWGANGAELHCRKKTS